MSLQDSLFCEDAEEDVKEFLKSEKRKRVLVFPPVNNYRRFLIHQLVQDHYGELLQTFSIGQGFARRTVICYKSDFIRPPQVNGTSSTAGDRYAEKSSYTMGIESQCTPTASPEHSAHKPRQVKSTPAVEIYRPPAARRARLENSPAGIQPVEQTTSDTCTRVNRQKRPDRAVYVPRHRRSAPDIEANTVSKQETRESKKVKDSLRTSSKPSIDRITNDRIKLRKTPLVPTPPAVEKMDEQIVINPILSTTSNSVTKLEEQTNIEETSSATIDHGIEIMDDDVIPKNTQSINNFKIEKMEEDTKPTVSSDVTITSESEIQKKIEKNELEKLPACLDDSDKRDRRKSPPLNQDENVSENKTASMTVNNNKKCNESDNFNSETTKIELNLDQSRNEQNNQVIKQALVSQVLVISSKVDEIKKDTKPAAPTTPIIPMTPPEKKVKKVERPKSKPAPPPLPPTKINRDECDWDSLFDDNGDCLDPTLIDELTSSVGEVVIEKPKSSYKGYTRPVEISSDEFAHVLEIYNFPSEFKSSDLAAVFSPFKNGGFELKWVDDTHCLGVFSSPLVAAEVLASDHPFVKTRPLSEATSLSKTKARKSSEFLQPYRTRPETCAAVARRIITKSLGVTLATARQEREQEKIILREAKEKKRLANKQREDVWEGIIASKPTS